MPFGGLGGCLPLRLGDSPDGGITAAQHCRFASDLAAVSRTLPALRMRLYVIRATNTVIVTRYTGGNGDGTQFAPFASVAGNTVTVALARATNAAGFAVDVAGQLSTSWFARARDITTGNNCAVTVAADLYTFSFNLTAGAERYVEIVIYGKSATYNIGDYGGDLDKQDSKTEGRSTYAYQWYRALKYAEGSAYSTSDTSVRSWEIKAHARALGTSQRISELLAVGSAPGNADLLLDRHALTLAVQTANVPRWKIRRDCEIRFSDYNEPDSAYIAAGVAEILGPAFNSIQTPNIGDLTTWPPATYQTGYVNGDAIYDISGNGMFSTSRSTICIVVNRGVYTDAEITDLMSRDVYVWLLNNLPATKSFYWTATAPGGFTLGVSTLGVDSL